MTPVMKEMYVFVTDPCYVSISVYITFCFNNIIILGWYHLNKGLDVLCYSRWKLEKGSQRLQSKKFNCWILFWQIWICGLNVVSL